jgi:hypothetical protein
MLEDEGVEWGEIATRSRTDQGSMAREDWREKIEDQRRGEKRRENSGGYAFYIPLSGW